MNSAQKTISLAATAAMLAVTGLSISAHAAEKAKPKDLVHCYGINTCKGTSDCATAKQGQRVHLDHGQGMRRQGWQPDRTQVIAPLD